MVWLLESVVGNLVVDLTSIIRTGVRLGGDKSEVQMDIQPDWKAHIAQR